MRRWHQDRALMERRVKFARSYFSLDIVYPPSVVANEERYSRWREKKQELGRWRKQKPGDCGRARCGICHDKWGPKKRQAAKQAAIQFELDA